MKTASAVSTASGEPGRQRISLPFATPAVALESIAAAPTFAKLWLRSNSPNPLISFSK